MSSPNDIIKNPLPLSPPKKSIGMFSSKEPRSLKTSLRVDSTDLNNYKLSNNVFSLVYFNNYLFGEKELLQLLKVTVL